MRSFVRSGVTLRYEDTGTGGTPMLLIHAMAADHTLMAPIAEHASRSRRVVSVDLRGHGESDKPDEGYTIPIWADDIEALIKELGLSRVVVVGHSLGGVIAMEVARRLPEVVEAVVTVDSPFFFLEGIGEKLQPIIEGVKSPDPMPAMMMFSSMNFTPSDSPERKAEILRMMNEFPPNILRQVFFSVLSFDGEGAVRAVKAPALYIHTVAPVDTGRLAAACPNVTVKRIEGPGHYVHLEQPEKVNAEIDGFLAGV